MLGHILTSPINEDNNTNTTTTATTITNPESIPSVSITPSPSPWPSTIQEQKPDGNDDVVQKAELQPQAVPENNEDTTI